MQAFLGGAVALVLALIFLPAFSRGHLAMPPVLIFVRAVTYEFAIIAANLFLAIIIHETGHMIAGLCSGYRVDFVRFGPIQINPPLRVSRAPKFGIYLPGAASLLPRRKDRVHARAIIFVLGGPLANLISAGCVFMLPRPLPGFAVWFAGFSLLLGLMNLIPFVRSGVVSDGKRILMIWRRTPRGERWLAICQLYSALWDGVLPENLDPEMLDRATAVSDRLMDTVAGHLVAYRAAFDLHRDAEAARLLETALQYYPYTWLPWKQELMVHAAVFQARRGGRVDLAEQWIKDLLQNLQIPGLREQAEAAILEVRKEPQAALEKLGQSEKAISGMPSGFERDLQLGSVARWQNELKARVAASSTGI